MSVTDKGPKYDFYDVSRTDSQKWNLFSKDLSHHVMNTHSPLGSLTDSRAITLIEDSPGDDLWGLTKRQPFSEKFYSGTEKSFITFKDTWLKVQMLVYTILDACFLASDTELINKYSYMETRARIEQYLTAKSESGDPVSDEYAVLHSCCSSYRSVLFFYIILIRNTVWKKPLMLSQCSLRMMSLEILSKMALKWNFKNGATLLVLLGLIYNVLLPSMILNILLLLGSG
jgi:hypothetical protein